MKMDLTPTKIWQYLIAAGTMIVCATALSPYAIIANYGFGIGIMMITIGSVLWMYFYKTLRNKPRKK